MSNQEMDNLSIEELLEEKEKDSGGEPKSSDGSGGSENNENNVSKVPEKKDRKTVVRNLLELGRSKGKLTTQEITGRA